MIQRLLVANRGEIARRVIRTCRDLGIAPIAVHSDPDAAAPHVAEADAAVRLPGSAATDTYLRADLVLAAARRAGADAVHPGYGFLAESAPFAQAVLDAGLTWVGPPPAAIAAMGSKIAAKDRVAATGIPVLPSWPVTAVPADARYPLLVKATFGGGGRGMRVVRSAGELASAAESAGREAASAFADGAVFVEAFVDRSRHVEVQIVADQHGAVVALGERECSIQRRHQKIIEEAPSPAVSAALRAARGSAAVAAMREIGYVGAGTVEFLLAPDGAFYFLEVNTRLQVEHPVTECVLGVDLVALQLAIAEGQPLPGGSQLTAAPNGHAVEARLYAEDPGQGWLPSTGTLHRFRVPGVSAWHDVPPRLPGLRLDSGVTDGSVVSPHYDSLLAKVIAWGPTRSAAIRRLAAALAGAELHGVTTNRDLLVRVLRHAEFEAGNTDTGFLDRHAVFEPLADAAAGRAAALAAALASAEQRRTAARVLATLPAGWRNNPSQPAVARFHSGSGRIEVTYRPLPPDVTVHSVSSPAVDRSVADMSICGVRRTYTVHRAGSVSFVYCPEWSLSLTDVDDLPEPSAELPTGSLTAPMPGTVIRVVVGDGDQVRAGQPLLVIEAMKMEHQVCAPAGGTVRNLRVTAGATVTAGQALAVVDPDPTAADPDPTTADPHPTTADPDPTSAEGAS